MGLDMYLTGKQYLYAAKSKQVTAAIKQAGLDCPAPVKEISVEAAYWRKANAIHKWFVDHVQDGVDDCEEYYVSRETLQELLDTVKEAIKAYNESPEKAANILPTENGFFFGSTEIDVWYLADLKNTVTMLKRVLSYPQEWHFYYRSSW